LVAPYLAALDVLVTGVDPSRVTVSYPGAQPPGQATSTSLFGIGRSVPNVSTGVCRVDGSTQRSEGGKAGDVKAKSEAFPKGGGDSEVDFAGLDERYFIGAVYPVGPTRVGHCTVSSLTSGSVQAAMDLPLPAGQGRRFGVFLGPKDFDLLRRASQLPEDKSPSAMLEGSVDFGFWTALCVPMLLAMEFFHGSVIHNWGVAILLLTLAIKLILFPFQGRYFKSMEQMRKLAPQIEALKKKYANDKERLNAETMKLYSDNGANPFSSCLPMLLQLPIWFALYRLLGTTIQLYREPFLAGWINDLTAPDPFYVLPLGMGGTMIVTQLLTPQTTLDNTQQKFMMWFMPAFFTLTFLKVPAGLSLYIFSSNLLNIVQQYWLRRRYGNPATPANSMAKDKKDKE
jgi:YidC/Oxa1 family membrane protein insertase